METETKSLEAQINTALAKAWADFPHAKREGANPHFGSKYAPLSAVLDAIKPALAKNGLCISQRTRIEAGELVLVTELRHSSGGSIVGEMAVRPEKPGPQALGSVLTYCRRFALSAIVGLGVQGEDDDAETATDHGADSGRRSAVDREASSATRPSSTSRDTGKPLCPKCGTNSDVIKSKKGPGFYCFKEKYSWTPEGPQELTAEEAEKLFR